MIAIWVILVACILLGIYFLKKLYSDVLGVLMIGISVFLLFVSLFVLPLKYYSNIVEIRKFQETKATYERIRAKTPNSIESAAIQIDIAKMNRWLVGIQYWNKTIFDVYISDEVEKLKPIE